MYAFHNVEGFVDQTNWKSTNPFINEIDLNRPNVVTSLKNTAVS